MALSYFRYLKSSGFFYIVFVFLESLTNLVYLGQQTFSFAQKHLTARVTFSCHARKYSGAIYMLAKQVPNIYLLMAHKYYTHDLMKFTSANSSSCCGLHILAQTTLPIQNLCYPYTRGEGKLRKLLEVR